MRIEPIFKMLLSKLPMFKAILDFGEFFSSSHLNWRFSTDPHFCRQWPTPPHPGKLFRSLLTTNGLEPDEWRNLSQSICDKSVSASKQGLPVVVTGQIPSIAQCYRFPFNNAIMQLPDGIFLGSSHTWDPKIFEHRPAKCVAAAAGLPFFRHCPH